MINRRDSVSLGSVVGEQTGAGPIEPIERRWDAEAVGLDGFSDQKPLVSSESVQRVDDHRR